MENPQRVIYARAILVAGSCPVSQTLSTPSLLPPARKRKRRNPAPRKKETRAGQRNGKKRKKEEGGGDIVSVTPRVGATMLL